MTTTALQCEDDDWMPARRIALEIRARGLDRGIPLARIHTNIKACIANGAIESRFGTLSGKNGQQLGHLANVEDAITWWKTRSRAKGPVA